MPSWLEQETTETTRVFNELTRGDGFLFQVEKFEIKIDMHIR